MAAASIAENGLGEEALNNASRLLTIEDFNAYMKTVDEKLSTLDLQLRKADIDRNSVS